MRSDKNTTARRSKYSPQEDAKRPDFIAIILAILVFAITLGIMIPSVSGTSDSSELAANVVSSVVGEDTTIVEVEEKLSASMQPIAMDENSPFYQAFIDSDRVNFMLLGVNDQMTDTIMIGSYDMDAQQVDIISIPRDTFYYRSSYANANYAFHKINSIYRTEGVSELAGAVSSLLYGMPIHYYGIVEYNDIRKVMDAMDGVEINVPFHMKYQDTTPGYELYIDIPAGEQTIDGSNVIEFLRFRHTNPSYAAQGYKSYPGGDVQRTEVHREFVTAVIKKCLNLGNLKDVCRVVLENIDSDLTYATAVKVAAKAMSGLDPENINSYMLPGTDKIMNELSFWVLNESETYSMIETIYHLNEPEETDAAEADGAAQPAAE